MSDQLASLSKFRRIHILGGAMDLFTPSDLFDFIVETLARGRRTIIATHNVLTIALIRRNIELQTYYALSALIQIDSMPLIFWGRILGLGT